MALIKISAESRNFQGRKMKKIKMITHLPADTGRKVFHYDPVFSTNRRPIAAARVQRENKHQSFSVRNLELQTLNVFFTFLQDLSQAFPL